MKAQTGALALKESIAHFAFSPAPASPPLRRSTRLPGSVKVDVKSEPLPPPPLHQSSQKRKRQKDEPETASPSKRSRPTKRGYAHPETYAHLKPLDDYLAPHLDITFCGVNPGQKSALTGHHFANPTNHFWRCLHRSGLTPRLLSPSEDSTLPSLHNLGLTNLVERPSVEQAELSKEEMKLSVPALKAKIITHRPHIFCFVGKGIWLIVEAAFKDQISNTEVLSMPSPSAPKKPHARRKAKQKANPPFCWGLQPYKFVYPDDNAGAIKSENTALPNEFAVDLSSSQVPLAAGNASETLLFVMPSTSGRVVSHQLDDKVKLFAHLRADIERKKSNILDTSNMIPIPLI